MILSLLIATAAALTYPPDGYVLEKAFQSSNHTFRVESFRKEADGSDAALCVWIVKSDGSSSELLVPPGVLTPLYSVEIDISPTEKWILWKQKLYHPANAYGLFQRVSDIHFKEIGPPLFSDQAWEFMGEQTHHSFKIEDSDHIMRVSDWPTPGSCVRRLALYGDSKFTTVTAPNDHSLAISLYGNDQLTAVDFWFCFYDLEKHEFYLNKSLQKHNKGTVGAATK